MRSDKRWELKKLDASDEQISDIASKLRIRPLTAKLLALRGYTSPESAKSFLKKETVLFHDPFLMPDMEKACDRILEAVESCESIMIYGDYDVDGVTSVSSLYLYLQSLYADVEYYIPRRDKEGYGVNRAAIEHFAQAGVSLIITVDTGVTAVEEVKYASELGVDIVITDHHECPAVLPDAVAVVNPRRKDSIYPFDELAGVGVVFKLISALERIRMGRYGNDDYLRLVCKDYVDLAALGTIADVMPLVDENRLIVALGLNSIKETSRPGLIALINESMGKNQSPTINSSVIGFTLAPRINAAGRMDCADCAVELLTTDSKHEAESIAALLCETNVARQKEENSIAKEAYARIDSSPDIANDLVIVLEAEGWHHGVIGIVASRITEKYNKPCILISSEDGIGKGSGRSVPGINLVDALASCSDILIKYGGHELAAGLSIESKNTDELRRRINLYAKEKTGGTIAPAVISVDLELEGADITIKQAIELEKLEPFGSENPVPIFLVKDAVLESITSIGQGRHTRMTLNKDGTYFPALAFGVCADELDLTPGDHLDFIGNLNFNQFRGQGSVQLVLRDFRYTEEEQERLRLSGERYASMRAGEVIPKSYDILPTRQDFTDVYLHLKKCVQTGKPIQTVHSIDRALGSPSLCPDKIRTIIDIFDETQLFGIEKLPSEDESFGHERMRFTFVFKSSKVVLEKASLYKWIRSHIEK